MSDKLVHIIDDEDAVRRSLDFLLSTAGFRAKRWGDGPSFLKKVDRAEPACVLLDIKMPEMDGLEVQKAMAERGIDFPVIVLTGHGDTRIAVRAMKAGAFDFLEKPFDRDALLTSIGNAFAVLSDRDLRHRRVDLARIRIGKLTDREREVLEGLACGYPNKTIGYDLGISARTVEVYRANAMEKLEAASLADLLRIAFAAGLGSEAAWRAGHPRAPQLAS